MPRALQQSYKNRFPFRIGTTSFIYPDQYIPNVALLGPYLDEIELLFLESDPRNSLPSESEIDVLAELAHIHGIRYNIHLPTDMDPGAASAEERRKSVATVAYIQQLTMPLTPSTFTLHLPADERMNDPDQRKIWLGRTGESLDRILEGISDSRLISVETLHYPFEWVAGLVQSKNLSVCLDVGHALVSGTPPEILFEIWADRISIIHLHGVSGIKDHISLKHMPEADWQRILPFLQQFTGIVSVEVFAYPPLAESLQFLNQKILHE